MKKFFSLICFCILFCSNAFAESPVKKGVDFLSQFTYDVSVGVGVRACDKVFDTQAVGFQAGIDVKKDIKNFCDDKLVTYGLAGVHLLSKGGSKSNSIDAGWDRTNTFSYGEASIPLHAGVSYKLKKVRLFIDLGPSIGFKIGGNSFDGLETKSFDCGLGANFGVKFKKVALSFGGDFGLIPIAKYEGQDIKSTCANFSLVWSFGKKWN